MNQTHEFESATPANSAMEPPIQASRRKERAPISFEKRQELIALANRPGSTVKQAAKLAGMNYSTAKHIVKAYRSTGHLQSLAERKRSAKQARLRELWMLKQLQVTPVPEPPFGFPRDRVPVPYEFGYVPHALP